MLLKAITEANNFFEQHNFPQRFSVDINPSSDLYEVYMAKGSGKPKSDYPSKINHRNKYIRFWALHAYQASQR